MQISADSQPLRGILKEAAMKINYLAVVVSAVVYWLVGGLWYGLLFGPRWMALENLTAEQGKSMNAALLYIITFVLNLLIAYVLANLCSWRNANTAARGAAIGLLLWIGFIGPVTYTTYMYEMRPVELFAINECYPLAGLVLMGIILGAWTKKAA
jgi:surface polysaccharide O-acyltransferase-like enzyme